jgi:hypothetical protein
MTGVVDEITAYRNAVAVQTKSQYANKLLRFPVPVQDLQAVYLKYPEMRTELLLDELTQHSVVVDKLLGRPMCGRVWHNYSQKNKEVFNLATLLITVKWPQLFERIKINAKGIQLSAMAEKEYQRTAYISYVSLALTARVI